MQRQRLPTAPAPSPRAICTNTTHAPTSCPRTICTNNTNAGLPKGPAADQHATKPLGPPSSCRSALPPRHRRPRPGNRPFVFVLGFALWLHTCTLLLCSLCLRPLRLRSHRPRALLVCFWPRCRTHCSSRGAAAITLLRILALLQRTRRHCRKRGRGVWRKCGRRCCATAATAVLRAGGRGRHALLGAAAGVGGRARRFGSFPAAACIDRPHSLSGGRWVCNTPGERYCVTRRAAAAC